MVRGTSNTLTYLIILGVTLSIIAYSLSAFLQFQAQIKEPVRQSLNATARSSADFQAALSDDAGFFSRQESAETTLAEPDSSLLSIETFPPYFQGAPALFQATILNPTSSMMAVEKLRLEVLRENTTISPEPQEFEWLEIAYKRSKDAYFVPQEPGNYTLRAQILQNGTAIKSAEKGISVQPPPSQRQALSFSGTADFSPNITKQTVFYYELKARRFPASGSGRNWHATIPQNFTHTDTVFLNITKNANTGIGSQFILAGGSYFTTEEEGGQDTLLTSEKIVLYPNTTSEHLSILAASDCGATVQIDYWNSTETKELAAGADICPLNNQCPAGTQAGAALRRLSCGESSGRYLTPSRLQLRMDKVSKIEIQPKCALYLAGLTLSTAKTHEYGQPSSVYLTVQNTTQVFVNNKQRDYEPAENFNTALRKIDLTDEALSGAREFNISTSEPISFVPYLSYAEILNSTTEAPNTAGRIQSAKLTLTPELGMRSEDLSFQFSHASGAGSCYYETGEWSFGAKYPEVPEAAIGTIGVKLATTFLWPTNPQPFVSATLNLPSYQVFQTAAQTEARGAKAAISLEGYNTPQDSTPAIYSRISHSDANANLDYRTDLKLKLFFGSVEATDYYYPLAGITDATHTITLPDGLAGLYLIVKAELPQIKYPYGAAGIYAKADLLGNTYSARGYKELKNGWNPQGYAEMSVTDEAVFEDLSGKALPNQQITIRTRTETDLQNTLESASASVHLIAVNKRPMRTRLSAGNSTIYRSITEAADIPLENTNNISARIDGTGKISGELSVSATKSAQAKISAPMFSRALLLLEPNGTINNLKIFVNGRAVKEYPGLSAPDKADLTQSMVPEIQNTLDFSGKEGRLGWKLVFE